MAFDASSPRPGHHNGSTLRNELAANSKDLLTDAEDSLCPDSQREGPDKEDFDIEQSYLRRLDELTALAAGLDVGAEAPKESNAHVEDQARDQAQAKAQPGAGVRGRAGHPAGRSGPLKQPDGSAAARSTDVRACFRPRTSYRESPDFMDAIRKVSASSAAQALGLHASKHLLAKAQENLALALLAMSSSYALQLLAAPHSSAGLMLAVVAWIGGAYWTVEYFNGTRKLSQEYRTLFSASQDLAPAPPQTTAD